MATSAMTVTVFGSSRPNPEDPEYIMAYELGRELSETGFVVCNGGYAGIMEASARGAKASVTSPLPLERRTVGVVASAFGKKSANRWIDRVITVETMVDRLLNLIALGDAYVILKGGTGTLLELAAVWEFMNKGMMEKKPIIILGDFWDRVAATLRDELVWEGSGHCTSYVTSAFTPRECIRVLAEHRSHHQI